jgi:hypothetical protein
MPSDTDSDKNSLKLFIYATFNEYLYTEKIFNIFYFYLLTGFGGGVYNICVGIKKDSNQNL